MNRIVKVLLWLLGSVAAIAVAGHFTLRHSLNTPKFKEAATGFVERAIGRKASYERIDYRLFPFSLVVRNAALKEADGADDFASIGEFSIFVDWRAKEISSLKLAEPRIRIVRRADGTFNFSDLLPAAAAEPLPDGDAPAAPAPRPAPGPSAPKAEPAAAPALRLVRIERAHFEFVAESEEGGESLFALSNLDFSLEDFSPDRPFRMSGGAQIGGQSSVAFRLDAPPPPPDLSAWPVQFAATLDVRDFADLSAFLPADALPFASLSAQLDVAGAMADGLTVALRLETPAATERHPVALDVRADATVALPAAVLRHFLSGEALAETWLAETPPCEPPPGTAFPAGDPAVALLLRHLRADLRIDFPAIAYAANRFSDGVAVLELRDGELALNRASLSAYGGTVDAVGGIHLLACPLSYRLERIEVANVELAQAIAANGLDAFSQFSGRLNLEASVSGQAVAEAGLRSHLEARATARIEDLQSVGPGGSLMDQVWRQLDQPLLLRLAPRIRPKVEQARAAGETTTTSRYETASATLALRDGVATLADARLGLPDYRIVLAGAVHPFDDRIDLAARILVSPEETERLTDGKDRSAFLPYEDGGLAIPISIRGSMAKPVVAPDAERLLQNALSGGGLAQEIAPHLERLSESDQRRVQEGLQLLQGLGRRPK